MLFSILLIGAISCKEEKAVDQTTKIIISHPEVKDKTIVNISTPFSTEEVLLQGEETSVDLDVDGLTTISYRIGRNNGKMIVDNGGRYMLSVDTSQLITRTDSDDMHELYSSLRDLVNEGIGDFSELSKEEEGTFIAKIKEVKAQVNDKIMQSTGDKEKLEFLRQEFNFAMANYLGMYQGYHAYFTDKEDFETSDEFKAYQSEYRYDAGIYGSNNYNEFLSTHYSNLVTEDDDYYEVMLAAARAEKDPKFAAYAEGLIFKNMLRYDDKGDYGDAIDQVLPKIEYQPLKNGLTKNLNKWKVIEPGKAAPVFTYDNLQGEKVSLSDFKGKYVYVDVWATWCGPCKAEAPYFEELAEKYKENEDIVFMGVSIDQDKAAWEKMVAEKEMKGVQLIADKAWSSAIAEDYLIQGIPRFLLIGKDGEIVDATAPRPSEEVLSELLGELVGGV